MARHEARKATAGTIQKMVGFCSLVVAALRDTREGEGTDRLLGSRRKRLIVPHVVKYRMVSHVPVRARVSGRGAGRAVKPAGPPDSLVLHSAGSECGELGADLYADSCRLASGRRSERRCAQIASFPPATPFSALGGEGSPGTLGTRQGTPLGGAWLWRGAGRGGSPHPRATSRPMLSPAFGSGADYVEGDRDSEALAA